VSFLAAAILYYFAAGDVKGFAFTLGLSTILDLVVVFLFTHPMVSLLSRSRAFGSARFTGLANVRAGGIVRSEDDPQVRRPVARPARGRTPAAAAKRSTATVVLDKEDEARPVAADVPDDVTDETDEPAATVEDDESQPRRRTTPEAGSAAERAAARRARLREQGEGKGKS
jgi:preprotein translocase subunit SecD